MPQIITTLPNNATPVKSTTLLQILAVLPDTAPFAYNFALGDRLLRDGQTAATNIFFYTDIGRDPTSDERQAFSSYLKPLGLTCTVLPNWGTNLKLARIYNSGKLCVDRTTGQYTQLPEPSAFSTQFTIDQFKALLPATLPSPSAKYFPPNTQAPPATDPLQQDIYLTGSLALNLWTCNDVDLMAGTPQYDANNNLIGFVKFEDKVTLATIRNYFQSLMPVPVQVGQIFMLNREPPTINAIKIYSGGSLCLA